MKEAADPLRHEFKYAGKARVLIKRKDDPNASWVLRIYEGNRQVWRSLQTHVRADAERIAKEILKASFAGIDIKPVRVPVTPPSAPSILEGSPPATALVTIGQIVESYGRMPDRPKKATCYCNLWAMRTIIQSVHKGGPGSAWWKELPATILTDQLIYDFRNAILERCEEQEMDAVDAQRAQRSANSTLRQARSIFNPRALEYYERTAKLKLPDLVKFQQAPGFRGVKKQNYHPPDDVLIARTLTELESSKEQEPERYLICWLALGFGLRKGEISALRSNWFLSINERIHLELRATTDWLGAECPLTKNGQVCPRIPVANGAWPKLQPIIARMPEGRYLIEGSRSWRTDDVFREVNEWMRGLGWQTQKGIHELRAFGGCRVIMRNGIMAGSEWLRHNCMSTTQLYYGRYIRNRIDDEPVLAPDFRSAPHSKPIAQDSTTDSTSEGKSDANSCYGFAMANPVADSHSQPYQGGGQAGLSGVGPLTEVTGIEADNCGSSLR